MTIIKPNDPLSPRPDTAGAILFLEQLHPKETRHLVAIWPTGQVEGHAFRCDEPDRAFEWIEQKQGKANLYFQVNYVAPAFRGAKAKKADIVSAGYLHVDIDDASEAVLDRIRNSHLAPTASVFSGGGYHVYYRLAEACHDLSLIESLNRELARKLGGDNCHNVDRIMRLPGTLNLPNKKKLAHGRKVALAYVVADLTDWSRAYSIDQFGAAEDRQRSVSSVATSAPLGPIKPVDLASLPTSIAANTRTLIFDGDDPEAPIGTPNARYKSRSEPLFRVCCDLARAGVTDEVAVAILINPEFGISTSVLEKRKPQEYALRQITSARKVAGDGWPDVDRSGRPRPTLRNTMVAIQRLGVHCEFDVFHRRKIVGGHILQQYAGEMDDDVCARLRTLIIEAYHFDPGKEHTRDAVNALALDNAHHPIRDYLDKLAWDQTPRINTFLSIYFGAEETPLNNKISRVMLIAAVRRIRKPGVKFDQIIVLEGPQGSGKSTALLILAGGPENFSDADILSLDPKAQMEGLEGVWIYEISELEGISRADTNKVKSFASRSTDRGRPAYGHFRENRPRQNIFVGTTNDDKYLRDQTGNRRFWPVRTGDVKLEELACDRDQLWAEAAHYEALGESLFLPEELWPAASAEQEARVEDDPWFDVLCDVEGDRYGEFVRISTEDLLTVKLQILPDRLQQFHTKRLAGIMRKLGWEGPKNIRLADGKVVRGYERPQAYEDEGHEPFTKF